MSRSGLGRTSAPVAQPEMLSSGLAENGSQEDGSKQSGQQTSALTMTLFVAGGLAFALWVSQDSRQIVAEAPGPA